MTWGAPPGRAGDNEDEDEDEDTGCDEATFVGDGGCAHRDFWAPKEDVYEETSRSSSENSPALNADDDKEVVEEEEVEEEEEGAKAADGCADGADGCAGALSMARESLTAARFSASAAAASRLRALSCTIWKLGAGQNRGVGKTRVAPSELTLATVPQHENMAGSPSCPSCAHQLAITGQRTRSRGGCRRRTPRVGTRAACAWFPLSW